MTLGHILRGGVVLAVAAGSLYGQATFQGVGFLTSPTPLSRAWAVSGDGSVVVGESRSFRSGSASEAFKLTTGGPIEALGTLNSTYFSSVGFGVSGDGQVAVGSSWYDITRLDQATRWSGGAIAGLPGFPSAPLDSTAYAASGDGAVIVGFAKSPEAGGGVRDQAFRWTAAGGTGALGFLAVPAGQAAHRISWASGVSADGNTIVGFSASNIDQRAVVWRWPGVSPARLTGDTSLGSAANAVSDDGRVIVGYAVTADGGQSAFRWSTNEGFVLLGDLATVSGPPTSAALGVSADGSVIVGYGDLAANNFNGEAVVWDYAGMRSLREALINAGATGLTGWQLWWATAVSDDGQTIVGFGRNPSGQTEGFKAFLPRCEIDYNRDRFVNLDDLGDFITDYYTLPAIPGGLQPAAPTRNEGFFGPGPGCPLAGNAPSPYAADAYRQSGYRTGFSADGSNTCPIAPTQPFPNLDNLNDFITAFYGTPCP